MKKRVADEKKMKEKDFAWNSSSQHRTVAWSSNGYFWYQLIF
jgi:hypothetical protein